MSTTLTPAQVAQRVATTPAQRARELHNLARATARDAAREAVDSALARYDTAIAAATRQHTARLQARAVSRYHFEIQTHHDRVWASALYWKATRQLLADLRDAEALAAPAALCGESA